MCCVSVLYQKAYRYIKNQETTIVSTVASQVYIQSEKALQLDIYVV